MADRGVEPALRETYGNGVRKATYRDPDGNEIGFGGAPLTALGVPRTLGSDDRAVVAVVGGPVPHAGDEHRDAAGDRRDPQHEAEVGGQAEHARRRDQQQPAATISAAYSEAGAGAGIGGGGGGSKCSSGRSRTAGSCGGGGGASEACSVTTGRPCSASNAATIRAHSASSSRSGRTAARSGAGPRRRSPSLRAVGLGRCVLVHQVAGLHPAGPVDEEPVERRAGQEDGARVRADVRRRLEVGGDAGRVQDVEQVLADPRVDVAQRAPEGSVQAVVAAAAAPVARSSAPRGRARAPGSTRPSPRRSSVRRCRGWPRGSCRGAGPRSCRCCRCRPAGACC